MKFLIIFLIYIATIKPSSGFFGYSSKYNTHEEPEIAITTRSKPALAIAVQKFIEQSLDNFNPQDTRRWKMRYYENDAYFQPGGPLFIYLGGEWGISPQSITQGTLIVEMAQEMGGNLFYTEHRYYGQSRPTANTTTENLRYLTIDQALADIAQFISYIKASKSDYKDSEVILVGASYSGKH
jgi:Serine carboxypeptidase S28